MSQEMRINWVESEGDEADEADNSSFVAITALVVALPWEPGQAEAKEITTTHIFHTVRGKQSAPALPSEGLIQRKRNKIPKSNWRRSKSCTYTIFLIAFIMYIRYSGQQFTSGLIGLQDPR